MNFLINWIVSALVIIVAAYVLPGVTVSGFAAAFAAALVLGLVNAFIKPVLLALTLPINFLTFGLLTLVINAALILLVSRIVPGFSVATFWWALLFGMILSIVNYAFK